MMHTSLKFLGISLIILNISVHAQKVGPQDLRENLKLIKAIEVNNESYQTKFTESSEFLIVSRNRRTKEWTLRKGDVSNIFSPCSNNNYTGGNLDSDGNRFSIGCDDFSVEVWNIATGSRLARLDVIKTERSQDYLNPYISPDGKKIVVEIGERAELWDVAAGRKIADLTSASADCYCNRNIYAVEFSPNGKVAAVAFGGKVFLWNAENGELLNRLIDKNPDFWGYDEEDGVTGIGTVRNILFSKDSKMIITGSGIGITSLWNVETGELIRKFKKHKLAITALALSPDEKVLATGSRNQDVKLWELETGKQLFSLENRKEIRRMSFHPDGTRLLSMTSTYAFIWDAKTGNLLEEMPISDANEVAFSPNWKYVILPDRKSKTLGIYEYLGK